MDTYTGVRETDGINMYVFIMVSCCAATISETWGL